MICTCLSVFCALISLAIFYSGHKCHRFQRMRLEYMLTLHPTISNVSALRSIAKYSDDNFRSKRVQASLNNSNNMRS